MRTLDTDATTALAGVAVAIVQLIKIEFPEATLAYNTSNRDFTYDEVLYKGAYGLGTINTIVDQPGQIQGLEFVIGPADGTLMPVALDEADEVQGSPIELRTAIVDIATGVILDAPIDWRGTADTMHIIEDGEQSIVRVTAESRAVNLLRGSPSTYSDADQQALYPGDRACEYVVEQADKPVVWPAKEWFRR